jgi:hypothetical protein
LKKDNANALKNNKEKIVDNVNNGLLITLSIRPLVLGIFCQCQNGKPELRSSGIDCTGLSARDHGEGYCNGNGTEGQREFIVVTPILGALVHYTMPI